MQRSLNFHLILHRHVYNEKSVRLPDTQQNWWTNTMRGISLKMKRHREDQPMKLNDNNSFLLFIFGSTKGSQVKRMERPKFHSWLYRNCVIRVPLIFIGGWCLSNVKLADETGVLDVSHKFREVHCRRTSSLICHRVILNCLTQWIHYHKIAIQYGHVIYHIYGISRIWSNP